MSLSRRGMRSSRNPVPPPGFMEQVHDIIKGNTHEQNAAIVRAIHNAEAAIIRKLEKIMHTLDDVLELVTGQRNQIDSLVTLTRGLHEQVLDAMGSALTPSQQDRIDRIFQAVQDNAAAVAVAIKENTVEATAGAVADGPSFGEIKGANTGTGSSGSTNQTSIDLGKPA